MYVDFRDVKRAVTIHQTAQYLHLEMKTLMPGWHRAWCPRCEAHTLIIAAIYGTFYCAKDGVAGDQLSLYVHVRNVNVKEAAQALDKFFGVTILKRLPLQPAPQIEAQAQNGG
jgi:hypothetical protein